MVLGASTTATSWVTPCNCTVIFAVAVRLSSTATFFKPLMANPLAVTAMSYAPTGRLLNRYRPSTPVLVELVILVPVLVTSTVAFGTTPPLGSATVPTRLPLIACPKMHGTAPMKARNTNTRTTLDFILENIRTLHAVHPRQNPSLHLLELLARL